MYMILNICILFDVYAYFNTRYDYNMYMLPRKTLKLYILPRKTLQLEAFSID